MKIHIHSLIAVLAVALMSSETTLADGPPIQWQKTFGGSNYDFGWSVRQTSDGGYIIVGDTNSFGAGLYDIYLIKTDPNGDKQWQKTFGGDNNDFGNSVQQTSDGGYIIAGTTYSFGAGDANVYLIKTDPNGDEQWQKTFGGDNNDFGNSVQQTRDGGYIIAGDTLSFGAGGVDVYLIKTDPDGNELWHNTFGGSNDDVSSSVQQTSDGGYIIAGGTYSFSAGNANVYLIKTDPNGDEQWQKTFGGSNIAGGTSVQQTSDDGYIITGLTRSFGAGYDDVYLIKTDPNGNLTWQKTFGGSNDDGGFSVQQTSDGGYIIAGCTKSFGAGLYDVYLIKTDPNGNSQWQKTCGGSSNEYGDYGFSVQQTSDGGYIIAGLTYSFGAGRSDAYLIKLCSEGTLSGDLTCDGNVNFDDMVILADQWLQPPLMLSADIAPSPNDGIVNLLDFAVLAEDWLEGTQ